ncbi:MAG TPA: glutathione S-transferase family protein [Sphingopyxis sp.]|nr:glutathione S-transferase family protein [Sphingopyxis sp.]
MIIYGSVVSPFVRKLLAYLGEKGIEFELKGVGIGDPDPGFQAASPLGKMPAMDDDGFLLADSSAIIQYVEAKHPEPPLIPADPEARGRVIWWEEFGDTVFAACSGKMFFNRIVAPKFLGREGDLAAAALADLAVASPLMNFRHCGARIDAAVHPKIAAWSEAILSRPSMAPWIAKEERLIERVLAG